MLKSEKLIQIVQAWLGYISLEELTQALVERSSDIYSKVVDKGVQLVGNKLLLDSEVFTQFQQQQQIREALSQAERELPKESDSITKRALNWLNATTDQRIFRRLALRINAAVLNTLATGHPFQTPLDRPSLITAVTSVNQKLELVSKEILG
ncbi:MAG: hypothetical protein KME55_36715 [Nostoc indistinguendum CM1-VF10]|jgi:hypothetical protein|nr:hypothetical protein [Nostoc indistinguendum CM1-VF10]